MKYFDAHCHILADDHVAVCVAVGVRGFVCNATAPGDWNAAADFVAHASDEFGINARLAIGVHPWYIDGLSPDWDAQMHETLVANPSYMVGEIGLDKFRPDFPVQYEIFTRQVAVAAELRRVMHIHCAGAWGPMLQILRAARPMVPFVLHSYSGAPDLIKPMADIGAYFSYGNAVLDARRVRVRRAVVATPVDRTLVESDAGADAAHCKLPQIVAEIARLRGVDASHMAEIIYNNSQRIIKNG